MSSVDTISRVGEVLDAHPYFEEFLIGKGLVPDEWRECTLGELEVVEEAREFIEGMAAFVGAGAHEETIRTITIASGTDKDGNPEGFGELRVSAGEVVCIVGPTGSGKSRLLADIEWMAQGDTPTGRRVRVNDAEPDLSRRFGSGRNVVAQLSQNMNFVMDVSVAEFLALHAESRLVPGAEDICRRVIDCANDLAGEPFTGATQLTALSGGQSRALMIADTAILSASPVVLIDEIENAGIDRLAALELLTGEQKIVLMATHDPMLTLKADRRLVIENGGITAILEPTEEETALLAELALADARHSALRTALRRGERVGPGSSGAAGGRGAETPEAISTYAFNSTGGIQ
ncbi:MAG: ATP-binding cassette domain-containing protein [Spirochaetes bacterium]|jgi:ABC-type lipoprotein export system ATPase subunit|nr:ATP-binding cassette domain-containing protein [Spirochaetota bacterium]